MAKFRASAWWLNSMKKPFENLNYKGGIRNISDGLSEVFEGAVQTLIGLLEFLAVPFCPIWLPVLGLWLGYRAIKQKIVFAKGTGEKRSEWKKRPIGRFIDMDGDPK